MGFSSMTAFILHSAKNYFRVDIDMSVYQKLSLEVNYIGKNINNLIRKIYSDSIYTDTDIDLLLNYQKRIEKLITKEFSKLADGKKRTNSDKCSPTDLIEMITQFERNNIKVPDKYLYEEVYQQMRDDFLYIIELMEKSPNNFLEEADYLAQVLYSAMILEIPKKEIVTCSDEFFQFAESLKYKVGVSDGHFDESNWYELRELLEKYNIYELR